MKKLTSRLLKQKSAIITAFLAFAGFAQSCHHTVKYGVPEAQFIVKGKVESALTNAPINNISITLINDSIVSDISGNYRFPGIHDFPGDKTYAMRCKDIDDTVNGKFKTLDTLVVFTNPQFTGGDGEWYRGETEKVFNVKLKPE